jgi:hypothetical protein
VCVCVCVYLKKYIFLLWVRVLKWICHLLYNPRLSKPEPSLFNPFGSNSLKMDLGSNASTLGSRKFVAFFPPSTPPPYKHVLLDNLFLSTWLKSSKNPLHYLSQWFHIRLKKFTNFQNVPLFTGSMVFGPAW